MEFNNKEKIFRISKIVSAILCSVFAVGLLLQFICMLWLCLLPDKLSEFFENIQIWRPFITDMYPYSRAIAELCTSMLTYAFAIALTKNSAEVFSGLEKGNPIKASTVKRVAIIALICSVAIPLVHNLAFRVFVSGSFSKMGIDIGLMLFGLLLYTISLGFVKNN